MERHAILLDAGYLKHAITSGSKPLTATRIRALIDEICATSPFHSQSRLFRTYYYDAEPLSGKSRYPNPANGRHLDFDNTPLSRNNLALLQDLRHLPHLSIRLGTLRDAGWQLGKKAIKPFTRQQEGNPSLTPDDFVPAIQQKGVDMRIGLDIAALTLKGIVTSLVLVTNDSDFIPAMKFARREGALMYLVQFGSQGSLQDALIEHADGIITLDPRPLREI